MWKETVTVRLRSGTEMNADRRSSLSKNQERGPTFLNVEAAEGVGTQIFERGPTFQDDQTEFVRWWNETVTVQKSAGGGALTVFNADRRSTLSVDAAEDLYRQGQSIERGPAFDAFR
jgi:hypothetical protein